MTDTTTGKLRLAAMKHYAVLAYGAVGSIAAIGLMVVGVLLVGLAIPVLLAGLGLVEIGVDLTTGPLIVSGLVLGVAGGFFLGVASESPLGRGRRLHGFRIWEVGVGRAIAALGVGFGLFFAYRLVLSTLTELPEPLMKGVETLRAAGVSGMVAMPLIGVPLSLLVLAAPTSREWLKRLDIPAMFLTWLIAALISLT
jgi:hypothetical protein